MEEVKKEKKVRTVKAKTTDLSFEFAQNLEKHYQAVTKTYFDAHNELFERFTSADEPNVVKYDESNVKELDEVLLKIQNIFAYELKPILHWILTHYQPAANITNQYEAFINQLESQGATKLDNEGNIIRSTDVEAARNRSPLVQ